MSSADSTAPSPPIADRRPRLRERHGDTVTDYYEWLRDGTDPEVLAYLEAENAYLRAQSAHLAGPQEEIFNDIRSRTPEADCSAPYRRDHRGSGYWYYTREVPGAEHPLYCRVRADSSVPPVPDPRGLPGEEVLLDINPEAKGTDFLAVENVAVSPGGTLLAYAVDETGDERYQIRFVDLRTGARLPDVVDNTWSDLAWADDEHLFYIRPDEAWRPCEAWLHRIGSPAVSDQRVLDEPDERFWVRVSESRDRRWIVLRTASLVCSDVRLVPTADPMSKPLLVAPRREDVEYDVEPAGDVLLVLHNDAAEDFCLAMTAIPDGISVQPWVTIIEHQPGVRLETVVGYADHVAVGLRRGALPGVHVIPRGGDGTFLPGHDIQFHEALFKAWPATEAAYDAPAVRVNYTSLLSPASVYDYDVSGRRLVARKQTAVPDHPTRGPFRADDYVQRREWATAADGTRVPISLVHRAGLALDGTAPAVLYGYGAYEVSIDLMFQPHVIAYLDRGFVYAFAHVRGGGEMGRRWYREGRVTTKKNTFTDFVASARELIRLGYTSPDRLAAVSNSAGGLLLGAIANSDPQLFRAIFAEAPFVDPVTSLLKPEIPLTVIEWEEWGDPYHNPDHYAYIKSYSPYENVRRQEYPAILVTSSLNDTRVLFVEMAKWVASLRYAATNDPTQRPFVLKTELHGGHAGASGRYERMRDTAFEMSWLIDQLTR
jgi:oligopeptidase B